MLITLAGVVHLVEREQHLCGVVGVGIKLVIELEIPAARLGIADFHGPIAFVADFLGEHPVGGLDHARVSALDAGLAQCEDRLRRIPHWRHTGLHAESWLGHQFIGRLLDAQFLELIPGANYLRIVFGIAQAAQGYDGVQHGRIDGAQPVGHLQPREQPLFRLLEGQRAQRANMHGFSPVRDPIQNNEQIAPGEDGAAIPAKAKDGVGAPAHVQLVDSLLGRDSLERLFGVHDGQRNKNRPRPRRNLVDVEVEPARKENNLGRNRGHRVVVVLAQPT